MATKTISIDMDAYRVLKSKKAAGESFSEAIKRLIPKPFDVQQWFQNLDSDPVGDDFAAAVESVISQRQSLQNMRAFDDLPGHNGSNRSPKGKSKRARPGRQTKSGAAASGR